MQVRWWRAVAPPKFMNKVLHRVPITVPNGLGSYKQVRSHQYNGSNLPYVLFFSLSDG